MWEAIASLAWTILAAVVLYKLWPTLNDLLKRDGTAIEVGSFKLTISQATQNLGNSVADIQGRLAKLETRMLGESLRPELSPDLRGEDTRLLWVDDYPSNNAFMVENLKERGVEVELSLSTSDALRRLEHKKFPAIITDLGRKEGETDNPFAGLELIRAIRDKGIKTPILVFAGRRGLDNRDLLISEGAQAVTSSGVEVNAFIEKHLFEK